MLPLRLPSYLGSRAGPSKLVSITSTTICIYLLWFELRKHRSVVLIVKLFTHKLVYHNFSYGCQSSGGRPNVTSSTADLLIATGSPNQQQQAAASMSKFDSHPYDGPINFRALLWVDRGPIIWSMQTFIAVICFIEAILMQYLTYKVS